MTSRSCGVFSFLAPHLVKRAVCWEVEALLRGVFAFAVAC
jgi:hypothetical protein